MKAIEILKSAIKKREQESVSKDVLDTVKNWYNDRYEDALIQRNLLFIALIISLLTIAFCLLMIRYVKNEHTIEPFVIEIEKKTGVPTVVEPLTVQAFSANETVKRYFIWKYIQAREEYLHSTFKKNYYKDVRAMSSDTVYSRYRGAFGFNNPNSPYNSHAQHSTRTVKLKSMVFTGEKVAQIRVSIESGGSLTRKSDKIIVMEFNFRNIEMNEEERFINPLGFIVTLYRIEDEIVR